MDAAYENGFENAFSTGCQIIIADGLKGCLDESYVPVPNGEYIKQKSGRR